jgi:alpha-beta hydrolase superfamily lysophospholipase
MNDLLIRSRSPNPLLRAISSAENRPASTVEGETGLNIFFRSWHPDEKPQAIILVIPGFNAHSGYYEWVAGQFVADDLAVYAVGRWRSDMNSTHKDRST